MAFTFLQKAECAAREVAQRRRVYPRLVAAGKMKADTSVIQIAMMLEIEAEYRAKADAAGETTPTQGSLNL
jgi:hypothetical protein